MSGSVKSTFRLRRPCAKCPFRTDVPGYLRRERAAEIARSIAEGAEFQCHETTVEAEDGDLVAGPDSQFCAGALIVMEHQEMRNQHVRIAERLGLYDGEKLDMEAPVHRSLMAFVDHHGEDEADAEQECCHIVNAGCEAPAGLLLGGMVVPAERTGDVHECPVCGEHVCDVCSDADGVCEYCAEDQ